MIKLSTKSSLAVSCVDRFLTYDVLVFKEVVFSVIRTVLLFVVLESLVIFLGLIA